MYIKLLIDNRLYVLYNIVMNKYTTLRILKTDREKLRHLEIVNRRAAGEIVSLLIDIALNMNYIPVIVGTVTGQEAKVEFNNGSHTYTVRDSGG